jgi:hypothetical protein
VYLVFIFKNIFGVYNFPIRAYKLQEVTNQEQEKIKQLIQTFDSGDEFIEKVHNGFSEKIAYGKDLQVMYEQSYSNSK